VDFFSQLPSIAAAFVWSSLNATQPKLILVQGCVAL
jgi:hypothetical protein